MMMMMLFVDCVQSRSNTPSSRSRSPALDLVTGSGGGGAQLDAVSSDVKQAFALGAPGLGLGPGSHRRPSVSPSRGVGAPGLGLGPGSHPRPSAVAVVPGGPVSPACLGGLVSRDLLEATDYITGAVTSLVKELHQNGRYRNDNDN